jgi:hypothetical protein
MLMANLGWQRLRASSAIDDLLSDGMLWEEMNSDGEREFWMASYITAGDDGVEPFPVAERP